MFEGIRTALKSNVQQSILIAENNLDDEFAIRILKALFLVKYVKGFKPTARNIAILILDGFDVDLTKHKRRIEDALAVLEHNTYIQRNGDLFEFLTDEEKDVEQDIKGTAIDASEITKELETLLFDGIIKIGRIKHAASSQDYPFARYLDDRLLGQDYELSINVATPFHEQIGKTEAIAMRTMSRDELAVVINADNRFHTDLVMFKQTEKYVRQRRTMTLRRSIERISEKRASRTAPPARPDHQGALTPRQRPHVRSRRRNRNPIRRSTSPNRTRVPDSDRQGLRQPRRCCAGSATRKRDQQVPEAARTMRRVRHAGLTEAEQEILNFAQANARPAFRTTIKAVVEQFEKKSYGWSYAAILCTTASLIAPQQDRGTRRTGPHWKATRWSGPAATRRAQQDRPRTATEFTPAQIRSSRILQGLLRRAARRNRGKALGHETAARRQGTQNRSRTWRRRHPATPS